MDEERIEGWVETANGRGKRRGKEEKGDHTSRSSCSASREVERARKALRVLAFFSLSSREMRASCSRVRMRWRSLGGADFSCRMTLIFQFFSSIGDYLEE